MTFTAHANFFISQLNYLASYASFFFSFHCLILINVRIHNRQLTARAMRGNFDTLPFRRLFKLKLNLHD